MTRILVILWHPQESALSAGGFRRACEILQRFPQDGGRLEIIDAAPSYMAPFARDDIRIHPYHVPHWIATRRLVEWIWSSLQIIRIGWRLRREYDVIYVPYSEIAVTTFPAVILKRLTGVRLVLCNLNSTDNPFWRRLMNSWHRRADVVMTISKDLAGKLHEQGITGHLPINYTGLDVNFIKAQPSQIKTFDAIFVGRHVPEKGIDDYLKMLPIVVKERPDFKLVSVGSAAPEVWKRLSAELKRQKLEQHWEWRGVVSEEVKYALIGQARTMWFLSIQEGWGIAPQEALACHTLPLCYALPVYKESIADCAAVSFVAIGDWQQAAKEAIRLLTLPVKEAKQRQSDGAKFVAQFDWEAIAAREYAIIAGHVS